MKAIALAIVRKGVAEICEPPHVDVRVVDCDNIDCGDRKPVLPRGLGFEELVAEAGIEKYVEFENKERN